LYNAIAGCVYNFNPADATIAAAQQAAHQNLVNMVLPELLKILLDQEFLLRRFGGRQGRLSMPFSPWLAAGFPSRV